MFGICIIALLFSCKEKSQAAAYRSLEWIGGSILQGKVLAQWRSEDLEVGGTRRLGPEVPKRVQGGQSSQHITDIWLRSYAEFCVFSQTA